jgi:hypothetical protein
MWVTTNGVVVGPPFPGNNALAAAVKTAGGVVSAFITNNGNFSYDWTSVGGFYYSQANCTGTAYVNFWQQGDSAPHAQTRQSNGHVVLSVGAQQMSTITVASFSNGNGCGAASGATIGSAVDSTIDLTALYPGPLTLASP